jgi:hypothetical protein
MGMNALNVVMGPAVMTVGGVDVGFTRGGIEIRYPREYKSIEADQALGVILKKKTKEQFFVKTTLLEASLDNLALAWDQTSVAVLGTNSSVVQEKVIIITGPGPNNKTRVVTLLRCISNSEGAAKWTKDEEQGIEVEYECIKQDGSGGTTLGKMGTIVDTDGTLTIDSAAVIPSVVEDSAISPVILACSGGTAPYIHWTVVGGALPTGLSLTEATGAITGTPTTVGIYNFTAKIVDAVAGIATKVFSMTITAA